MSKGHQSGGQAMRSFWTSCLQPQHQLHRDSEIWNPITQGTACSRTLIRRSRAVRLPCLQKPPALFGRSATCTIFEHKEWRKGEHRKNSTVIPVLIIHSREISRLAIKAKDAKIAELQHRLNTLEAELETERAIVKHLRWEKEFQGS